MVLTIPVSPLFTLSEPSNRHLTVFLASSWGSRNRLGRSYVTQGDRKISDLPPLPHATVVQWRLVSCVFSTPPLPGWHRLLLAGAGRTQPIRMEEIYTPMILQWMRPARLVKCDSPVPDLFFTCSRFFSINVHFMKKCLKIKDSQDEGYVHIIEIKNLHNNCLSFGLWKCGGHIWLTWPVIRLKTQKTIH